MNTIPARAERVPLPFTPADMPRDRCFIRCVTAHAVAAARGYDYPGDVAREYWPRDAATLALIQRTASPPAMTSGQPGWADALSVTAVGSFIGSLSQSAGAQLISRGTRLDLSGIAQLTLPRANAAAGSVPQWIAEGQPISVGQGNIISGATIGPSRKLGLIEVVTRELNEATQPDAEAIIGRVISDAITAALDQSLFSSTAASSVRPAGLLNGITALTATTGGGRNAALADLRMLSDAIVAAQGSSNTLFFCSPGRRLSLLGYVPALDGQVFGSAWIPTGELIAVDANSFCSAFGADAEIRAAKEVTIVFDDSATPPALGTPGSPPVVGAPAKSLFQQDMISIRGILRAAWCLRVQGTSAWISTGLSW